MQSSLFSKKTLLTGAMCVGVVGLGLLFLRPNHDKVVIMPTAKADIGVLKMNDVIPKQHHVRYMSIHELNLTTQEKQRLLKEIHNLHTTGSSTGGILTTQFKQSTHAKMSYRFGRKQPLSFQAIKINALLPQGFILTGRQYEGQKGEYGFDGIYQFFENPTTKSRIEITQTKLHDNTVFIKELFNDSIDDTPLRLESLNDKHNNIYYHGEFVLGEIHIVINTKGLNLSEFKSLITRLIQAN